MRKSSHKLIDWMLVVFLFATILLVFVPTLLRNFGLQGIAWSEVAVRYLVIWLAFLGAAAAARDKQHIAINILPKLLPEKFTPWLENFASLVGAGVSLLLAWASIQFLLVESQLGGTAFLEIPTWKLELIIPIGFVLIAIEHCVALWKNK